MPETQKIEISQATYSALYLPINGQADDSQETLGERLKRKGLIGWSRMV
jgi:hypothetical protein